MRVTILRIAVLATFALGALNVALADPPTPTCCVVEPTPTPTPPTATVVMPWAMYAGTLILCLRELRLLVNKAHEVAKSREPAIRVVHTYDVCAACGKDPRPHVGAEVDPEPGD